MKSFKTNINLLSTVSFTVQCQICLFSFDGVNTYLRRSQKVNRKHTMFVDDRMKYVRRNHVFNAVSRIKFYYTIHNIIIHKILINAVVKLEVTNVKTFVFIFSLTIAENSLKFKSPANWQRVVTKNIFKPLSIVARYFIFYCGKRRK